MKAFIESGKAVMGIEFGSTRIKAVLVDDGFRVVAQGAHDWENSLVDGVWSYSLEDIEAGVRDAYAKCAADAEAKCGAKLTRLAALGVSGMMHGYLPFDANGKLLVPFRTWRNVMTAEAAADLSELFGFNVPQRWSIAHYYQAILRKEPHVPSVRWLTTLAGYVHYRLTGENVLGVGEASGMFPIDAETGDYNARMLGAFDARVGGSLREKLPKVLGAGGNAGVLTERGAKWLDPTGTLRPGAVMAPPEGDAGTGMVATNAVAAGTGNVSAGTSIFAMVVLDRPMKGYYPEIDVLTTPAGREVAMVHCNNCTNEINAWVKICGGDYGALFRASLKGAKDCGGVVVVPFLSGEPVTGVADAMLKVVRKPESDFTLANFFRAQIYSAFGVRRAGRKAQIRRREGRAARGIPVARGLQGRRERDARADGGRHGGLRPLRRELQGGHPCLRRSRRTCSGRTRGLSRRGSWSSRGATPRDSTPSRSSWSSSRAESTTTR